MDRELSAQTQRRSRIKTYSWLGALVLALALGVAGLRTWLKPSLNKADLRTAVVSLGPLEASLAASGITVPETEEIITSPIQARLRQVLLQAGDRVAAGQSVLELDKEATQTAYKKLHDEQLLKQNKASKLRIELQRNLNELQAQYRIKQMGVKSLESLLADEKYLLEIGGGTPENTRQAELNLQVARLELQLLADQIRNKKQAMLADLKELGFELDIQQRDIRQLESTLGLAAIKAGQGGVVTWVLSDVGAAVNAGDMLARVADLSRFKIKATLSDAYAGELRLGGAATVRVNDTDLRGVIANIEPTVSNGVVTFFVQLDQKAHALLRPNLRVEVFVVTAFKPRVLRVKNGPFYQGGRQQPVYVIRGDKALRRMVTMGESNFDFVELKDQVAAGEEVVISDMRDYEHAAEINLSN
ncbi:MAG: efflux RND transporter periplasmic adaptor subunit [Adhaeribacter sp.]